MIRKVLPIVFMVLSLLGGSLIRPSKTTPCIGRILFLGITPIEDQRVMAEILCGLITESTGTTVNIVEFKSIEECRQAMEKEELDLYIDYISSGLISVLNGQKPQLDQPDKAYSMVKHLFADKFAMVWLKPFGYDNQSVLKDVPEGMENISNRAVCVARKKLLERFPILPRLINKLKDKVSNQTIAELQTSQDLKTSAKNFLEANKLIRWEIPR